MEFATQNNCQIIIANDPDADRLCVAEYNTVMQKWVIFSGNEIGVLLGSYQIKKYKEHEVSSPESGGVHNAAVLASVVSSRMLKSIAETEHIQYYDTLTG